MSQKQKKCFPSQCIFTVLYTFSIDLNIRHRTTRKLGDGATKALGLLLEIKFHIFRYVHD